MNEFVKEPRERWDFYFDIERSMRYHKKRQAVFENLHVVLTIATFLFGSGAFMAIKDALPMAWAQYLAGIAAILSAISVVIRPSERARKHSDLYDKFTDLIKLVRAPKVLDSEAFEALVNMRLDIEKTEPKHGRALNAVCYHETAEALGLQGAPVGWFRRNFAHVLP